SATVNKTCDLRTLAGRTTGALSQGSYTIHTTHITPAPSTPDLEDFSDTGLSQTDNITRNNTPTFVFAGAPNQKAYLLVNGSVFGIYDTNPSSIYEVTCPQLPWEGDYEIAVKLFDPSTGYMSVTSDSMHIVIDTIAPTVQAPSMTFSYEAAPHALTVPFSEDIGASLGANDLSVVDLATQAPVGVTASYDASSHIARFVVASPANGVLPKGNYRAI